MAGITVQALLSLLYLNQLTPVARSELETLTEHGSAIGMNLLLITMLAALTLRGSNRVLRWILPLAAVPVAWAYLVSQRRSAIIALVIAGALLFVILFWRQRHTFFRIAPPVILVGIAYVGAFWNSGSTAGFPAQAIKSVVAADQASADDQSSDLYRIIENYDLNYTIRASPIRGLGFGQPFYMPIELPDISFFEFWAYLPHNSILWFWIKTGVFGFVAMFYLFGKTIMVGVDRVRRLPDGKDTAIAAASVLFVVMLVIYTYVDIAWDVRNMIIFGFAAAVCATPVPVVPDTAPDDPKDPVAQPVTETGEGQLAVAAQAVSADATRAA